LSTRASAASMKSMFGERLRQELAARRSINPRYSIRAFAAFLGADHSTLGQILRGVRPAPAQRIRAWAKKLGMPAEEAAMYVAAQHVPDAASAERHHQLRHWTAEAGAITADRTHWLILSLTRASGFQPDCRWIAARAGVTVDRVNLALARLLRLGLIELGTSGQWRALIPPEADERQFHELALKRVREKVRE
jgi:hypothetical protein